MKTLGYWLYAVQMQLYWTVVVTGSLFAGWYFGDSTICLVLMLVSLLATLGDFYGRIIVEYRQIRREVLASRYSPKVCAKWLRAQKFAACRRFATGAAIRDISASRQFYRSLGYRWWHVFPDDFHRLMWSAAYWKQALFKHDKK